MRFVCFRSVDGHPRQRLGLFQAIEEARESDSAPDWALRELAASETWFGRNLRVPDRFSRGSRRRPGQPGLAWFKAWSAEEHIRQMHRFKRAAEACGLHVDVLKTRDPGHILYEDEHQIVAEPGNRRFQA
ncbi:MAG: hypothetical protein KY449_01560 [Proteobacteria bacterium]|nr:hypothetical protein [Pseudomonadota bacterium]